MDKKTPLIRGSYIKKLIEEKGTSIEMFAKEIGLTRGGLYFIFDNNTTKISTLTKIAEKLNIPVMDLYEPQKTMGHVAEPVGEYKSVDYKQLYLNLLQKYNYVLEVIVHKKLNIKLDMNGFGTPASITRIISRFLITSTIPTHP